MFTDTKVVAKMQSAMHATYMDLVLGKMQFLMLLM